VLSTHLTSLARPCRVRGRRPGRGLALTGCDSGSGEDIAAAGSSELVEGTSAEPTNPYVVDSGDTLSGIAAAYGVSLSELVYANDWSDGTDHAIFPGDVIALPDGTVAVSTTRPPSNNSESNNDIDNGASATTSTAPTAAATSGGYTATGEFYVGPAFGGSTDPITEPLADGVYWSFTSTVSGDGSTITFDSVQQFSGDECREHFGTAPHTCDNDIDFEDATATASMRVGSGTASVLYLHGGYDVEAYRVATEELARLMSGQTPADDAPDGFDFNSVDPFVVTVQDGAVTAADQIFIS
jgi:LysM repeat protein